ncbi:MAG: hypothetical protein CMP59_13185 [Flavobacteriales bacterium]|nr:hypothetical protein [Flavobacteriales bacterium]
MAQRELPSDTFRVVKDYQPVLIDADKIKQRAEIDDTLKLNTKLEYKLIDRRYPVSFQPEPIEAARIKGEPLVKLYNGYARVGVGNALTPFAELYYNSLRSRKYAAGGHIKFLNQNEINDLKGSNFSQGSAQFYGKRFWKRNTLSTELNYGFRNFSYYGFYELPGIVGDELGESDLEQSYQRFQLSTELASTKQDSFNIRHRVQLDYSLISNESSMQENYFRAKANFSQFKNAELYQLDVSADYNKYDTLSENGIFALKPSITSFGNRFRIQAGLGVYMNASDEENASFHFYPLAEVSYDVLEDVLTPYAGVKGEIQRNNYFGFTQQNPFLAEQQFIANSNQLYNLFLGLRGAFTKEISYNLYASRIETEDAPFFLKAPAGDLLLAHQFFIAYDELTENKLRAEVSYHSEKVKVFLNAEYTDFETKDLERAWHRPELTASLNTQYNLYDKLILGLDIIYWSEQYAPKYDQVPNSNPVQLEQSVETLDAIFDLNLSFEYRYTKRLSAFIKFNNITGLNYEKYQDYPVQGFNVWGGLTYSF